jgi:hypothetical protein
MERAPEVGTQHSHSSGARIECVSHDIMVGTSRDNQANDLINQLRMATSPVTAALSYRDSQSDLT